MLVSAIKWPTFAWLIGSESGLFTIFHRKLHFFRQIHFFLFFPIFPQGKVRKSIKRLDFKSNFQIFNQICRFQIKFPDFQSNCRTAASKIFNLVELQNIYLRNKSTFIDSHLPEGLQHSSTYVYSFKAVENGFKMSKWKLQWQINLYICDASVSAFVDRRKMC